jgi:hypothetical protein
MGLRDRGLGLRGLNVILVVVGEPRIKILVVVGRRRRRYIYEDDANTNNVTLSNYMTY